MIILLSFSVNKKEEEKKRNRLKRPQGDGRLLSYFFGGASNVWTYYIDDFMCVFCFLLCSTVQCTHMGPNDHQPKEPLMTRPLCSMCKNIRNKNRTQKKT